MTQEYDELVKRLTCAADKVERAFDKSTAELWKEAASAITRLNADLAKKNEELEYAKAGIGYAEAAKLLETVDSLTADLASALEALRPFAAEAKWWPKRWNDDVEVHVKSEGDKPNEYHVAPFKLGDLRRAAAERAKHKKEG